MQLFALLLRQLQRLPGLLRRAIAAGTAAHTQAALLAANVVVLSIGARRALVCSRAARRAISLGRGTHREGVGLVRRPAAACLAPPPPVPVRVAAPPPRLVRACSLPPMPSPPASPAVSRKLRRAQFAAGVRSVQQLDREALELLLRHQLPCWVKVRASHGRQGCALHASVAACLLCGHAACCTPAACLRCGAALPPLPLAPAGALQLTLRLAAEARRRPLACPSNQPCAVCRLGARRAPAVLRAAGLAHLQPHDLRVGGAAAALLFATRFPALF